MKRLNAKQLLVLPKGKYHDGNGLYISISSKGKGKWSFRYRAHKKSREMGLGRFPDVSLFDARQHALSNKQLLIKNIDPIDEKNRAEVLRQQQNKKFSEIADIYISTKKRDEWTDPKSEQAWRNTITNYAVPYLDKKPLTRHSFAISDLFKPFVREANTGTKDIGSIAKNSRTKFSKNKVIMMKQLKSLLRNVPLTD